MSKLIKCDVCGETIDLSKRQTLEHIELNGIGLTVSIEILNQYKIPKPVRSNLPAGVAMLGWTRDENLDLCSECFAKTITALKARLNN